MNAAGSVGAATGEPKSGVVEFIQHKLSGRLRRGNECVERWSDKSSGPVPPVPKVVYAICYEYSGHWNALRRRKSREDCRFAPSFLLLRGGPTARVDQTIVGPSRALSDHE